MGEHFLSESESAGLLDTLKKAKKEGASSGGVFGSILVPNKRKKGKDIDILIEDPNAPIFGEIEHTQGEKSGTWLHIFRKKPGKVEGNSRRAEILNEASEKLKKIF